MKFYLLSLGCQMNISDGERVRTVLKEMNMTETDAPEDADILGIMACSVRQKAIDKVYSTIHRWNNWKTERSVFTFISGCILPSDREKFLKKFDLLFAINELPNLASFLEQYGIPSALSAAAMSGANFFVEPDEQKPAAQNDAPSKTPEKNPEKSSDTKITPLAALKSGVSFTPARSAHTPARASHNTNTAAKNQTKNQTNNETDLARGFWKYAPSYTSTISAFVTIQNGCDKFCTFCAVPYTRGREVSRASSEILREVHDLMQKGYRSITLLGQNVNSYGLDTGGTELSFAQLLERIGLMAQDLGYRCWIYFTSPHPRDMGMDVLEAMAKYDALAKQIHLPLQSGDDKLLMKMNRNHSMEKYEKIVGDIRAVLPSATLFTDIIVGFCGETRAQFENTKKAMERYRYAMAYIAMYSPRPGAASFRWQDSVPLDEKKARYHELSDVLRETSLAYCQSLAGTSLPVLVEGHERKKNKQDDHAPRVLCGHTEGKIPVYIVLPRRYGDAEADALIGTFADVRVTSVRPLSIEAELAHVQRGSYDARGSMPFALSAPEKISEQNRTQERIIRHAV